MPNEIKVERMQSTILRELNLILQREFLDSEYIKSLTIREVRLTNDMSQARIFYSILNIKANLADVVAEIKDNLKEIRMLLASRIDIKNVPELNFEYDKSLDNANKIDEILKKIK